MYNVGLWSGEQCHLTHPSILWKFIYLEYQVIHVDFPSFLSQTLFYQDASHADPGLNQQVSH